MFPQDRKYFRFRFSRVLALAFLLISPTQLTQASGIPASCAEVETALVTSPTAPPVEDPKRFVSNVVECCNVMTKEKTWRAIKNASELIQQLPELMAKAIPIGKKGGLVVLSAYVLYKHFELYDRAMNLARDYKFELLQEEMIPFRDYMESQLIPQWKKGNFANMQMITGKLLERLSRDSTVLGQLVQVIHQHAKKGERDKMWTAFSYGGSAIAVCAGSVYVGNRDRPRLIMFICSFSAVAVAVSLCVAVGYCSLDNTLKKLDTLWEDTTKMREEIANYRSQLDIAKMRGEFEVLLSNSTQ